VSSSVDGDRAQIHDPNFWVESDELEIIDSIPLEEVDSVRMGHPGNWGDDRSYPRDGVSGFLHYCFGPLANSFLQKQRYAADSGLDLEAEKALLERFPPDDDYEGFLKITTKPTGFNRGRPYYLAIRKDSYRSLTKPGGQLDAERDHGKVQDDPAAKKQALARAKPIRSSTDPAHPNDGDAFPGGDCAHLKDLDRVWRKLEGLADRRRGAFQREHRFQLLQEKLQAVWDSFPFNLLVLLLISSNFVFTVLQLENKDPARQPFFEAVDLAYTIIFTAGEPLPPATTLPAPRPSPINFSNPSHEFSSFARTLGRCC
jgi:hypothetical protein